MNRILKLSLTYLRFGLVLLFLSGKINAVNPPSSIYGGLSIGPSYEHDLDITFINPLTGTPAKATFFHGVFGDISADFGYRFQHFRLEGELFINYAPYKSIDVGSITVNTNSSTNSGLTAKGQTVAGAAMINAFYDFYFDETVTNFSPYLGLGVGYAYVNNTFKFYDNNQLVPNSEIKKSTTAPGAQAIIGLGYFLDDYSMLGLDLRAFTTKTIKDYDSKVEIVSFNITFVGSFDKS